MTDTARFVSLFEPIARHLLGEPNRRLSTKKELRFGARGSLSIDLDRGLGSTTRPTKAAECSIS